MKEYTGLPLQQDLACWHLKRKLTRLNHYESLKFCGGMLASRLYRRAWARVRPVQCQSDAPDDNGVQFVLGHLACLSAHKAV